MLPYSMNISFRFRVASFSARKQRNQACAIKKRLMLHTLPSQVVRSVMLLTFLRFSFRISTGTPTILTDASRGFPQFFKKCQDLRLTREAMYM